MISRFVFCFIVFCMYCLIADTLSFFAYRFCRKKKKKKECRNAFCKYARDCECNTFYV